MANPPLRLPPYYGMIPQPLARSRAQVGYPVGRHPEVTDVQWEQSLDPIRQQCLYRLVWRFGNQLKSRMLTINDHELQQSATPIDPLEVMVGSDSRALAYKDATEKARTLEPTIHALASALATCHELLKAHNIPLPGSAPVQEPGQTTQPEESDHA